MDKTKIVLVTEIGTEKTCSKDVKEFFNIKPKMFESYVSFELETSKDNLENLFRFSVLCQSIDKIIIEIAEFDFKDEDDLMNKIKKNITPVNSDYWFKDNPKFYVRCLHKDSDIDSRSLEPEIGSIIIDKYPDLKVSMENSDVKILVYVKKNKAILGVDLTKSELNKRQYKLINSGKSVRATIAYHLIREIDFKQGEILLDPNSKTGEPVIEAALYLTKMHNFYDVVFHAANNKLFNDVNIDKLLKEIKDNAKTNISKIKKSKKIFAYSDLLKDLNSGKANAKVAGILDLISFSKVSLDWVDAKFEKGSIDKIVTILPSQSKHVALNSVKKIYSEFLYQADYILNPNGKIGILMQRPKALLDIMAQKQKALKLLSSDKIIIGELVYTYLIITK